MTESASLADITFTENGAVDVAELNALYRLIGWDRHHRRTEADTTDMLRVSHYSMAACTAEGALVGFARVCGDPYVAQVSDVITHPAYRRRGIATRCMRGVVAHLQRSRYVSVTLTDGSGIAGFYQRFGFRVYTDVALVWERGADASSHEAARMRHAPDLDAISRAFNYVRLAACSPVVDCTKRWRAGERRSTRHDGDLPLCSLSPSVPNRELPAVLVDLSH
jgi:GNAT superfamily N-acetyltransferase